MPLPRRQMRKFKQFYSQSRFTCTQCGIIITRSEKIANRGSCISCVN